MTYNTAQKKHFDNDYIDKNGNHHRRFIDEDTGEEIDIIIDDEDFKNNHYEYDSLFDLFDDSDDEYVSNPKIEELQNEYNDITTELHYLKRRRRLLMIDMENDPDVINDLDGDAAQEYGLELGNIDEEIEKLQNRKKEIDKEMLSLEGLDESVNVNNKNIPDVLYHATPSCYLSSIKKLGLGAKLPKRRFWDYENTQYKHKLGVFLAPDEDYAYSFLDASDEFWDFADEYEDRYDKELEIVVFAINTADLDISKLYVDENNNTDDEDSITYFYDGVIPYKLLRRVNLNENLNEGRLQGYPIPGYRAAYNPADFDDNDIDIAKIDKREHILEKAREMITTEYFPVPDNRTRIRLSDDWSIILSNTLFNNTTEFMGAVSISLGYKNNKEYCYENGRLYKDYNDMLDVIERVINRVNNGYFEPYIYDKVDEMDDIRYSDRSYKNVKYYDAIDESIKSNKNDKALLESLIMKYGKDGVNSAITKLIK